MGRRVSGRPVRRPAAVPSPRERPPLHQQAAAGCGATGRVGPGRGVFRFRGAADARGDAQVLRRRGAHHRRLAPLYRMESVIEKPTPTWAEQRRGAGPPPGTLPLPLRHARVDAQRDGVPRRDDRRGRRGRRGRADPAFAPRWRSSPGASDTWRWNWRGPVTTSA